jgi:hypothetical protein
MCREAFFSSIIEALIDYCVEICAKPARIDARCASRSFRKRCTENEPTRPNRSQLRNRCAVARYHNGFAGFYFAQDCSRPIAKLALVNSSAHG